MRTYSLLASVPLMLMTVSIAEAQSAASKIAASKGWLADWQPALAQAKATGKPLMVVFRCDP